MSALPTGFRAPALPEKPKLSQPDRAFALPSTPVELVDPRDITPPPLKRNKGGRRRAFDVKDRADRTTITMPRSVLQASEDRARVLGISLSHYLSQLARKDLAGK